MAKKKKAKKAAKKSAKAKTVKKAKTKTSRAAKARKAPAKKKTAKTAKKPAARKPAKKTAKKKQIVGEGDYAATRKFDKDQAGFVARNRANIPAMGKQAEQALEGAAGDELRDAEARAAARSRDNF